MQFQKIKVQEVRYAAVLKHGLEDGTVASLQQTDGVDRAGKASGQVVEVIIEAKIQRVTHRGASRTVEGHTVGKDPVKFVGNADYLLGEASEFAELIEAREKRAAERKAREQKQNEQVNAVLKKLKDEGYDAQVSYGGRITVIAS